MYKRGQLTAFIIVGLVLIILFGLFFSMRNSGVENTIADFTAIENGIQSCSDVAASTAVKDVLGSGGQLDPDEYYYTQYGKVPFYAPGSSIDVEFAKEYIEQLYMAYLDMCLTDLGIENQTLNVSILSLKDKSLISLNNEFKVELGFSTKIIKGIKSDVGVSIDNILNVGNVILNATTDNVIPFSVMLDESERTSYDVEAVLLDDFYVYWIAKDPYVLLLGIGDGNA